MSTTLTLAHSPDPDDAAMWWPLTGKVNARGEPLPGEEGKPRLETGRWKFVSLPRDIQELNRRALERGDLEITALSVRTYADVHDRYAITACGASMGDGYGPKVVVRKADAARTLADLRGRTIAVPGKGTTAYLMLGLALGQKPDEFFRVREVVFTDILGAVASGQADAGLLIHEAQLTYEHTNLHLLLDVGRWWKEQTGLKLPLGINAVRRDLDEKFGQGSCAQVAALLGDSVRYAVERWDESVAYAAGFAMNNKTPGMLAAGSESLARVDAYCKMYVTDDTLDMGEAGRKAIETLLQRGADAGLCPRVGAIDLL